MIVDKSLSVAPAVHQPFRLPLQHAAAATTSSGNNNLPQALTPLLVTAVHVAQQNSAGDADDDNTKVNLYDASRGPPTIYIGLSNCTVYAYASLPSSAAADSSYTVEPQLVGQHLGVVYAIHHTSSREIAPVPLLLTGGADRAIKVWARTEAGTAVNDQALKGIGSQYTEVQNLHGHSHSVLQLVCVRQLVVSLDGSGNIIVWSNSGNSSDTKQQKLYHARNSLLLYPYYTILQTLTISPPQREYSYNADSAEHIGEDQVTATSLGAYIRSEASTLFVGCSDGVLRTYTLKHRPFDSSQDGQKRAVQPQLAFVPDWKARDMALARLHQLTIHLLNVIQVENLLITLSMDCTASVFDSSSWNRYFEARNSPELAAKHAADLPKAAKSMVPFVAARYSLRYQELWLLDAHSLYCYNIYEDQLLLAAPIATDRIQGLMSLELTNGDNQLLLTSRSHGVMLFDLRRQSDVSTVRAHTAAINSIASIHHDRHIVTASHDNTIRIYNHNTLQLLTVLRYSGHSSLTAPGQQTFHQRATQLQGSDSQTNITSLAALPHSSYCLTAQSDGSIVLWDIDTTTTTEFTAMLLPADGRDIQIIRCVQHQHSTLLFVVHYSVHVLMYDMTDWRFSPLQLVHEFDTAADDIITAFLIDVHTHRFYAADVSGTVHVHNYESLERVSVVPAVCDPCLPTSRAAAVTALAVDGTLLFTATDTGIITMYNTVTFSLLQTFDQRMSSPVASLSVIPVVSLLVLTSAVDGSVTILNYNTQQQVKHVSQLQKQYTCAHYDSGSASRKLFVGCASGELLVVDLTELVISSSRPNTNTTIGARQRLTVQANVNAASECVKLIQQQVEQLLHPSMVLTQHEVLHEEERTAAAPHAIEQTT